QANSRYRSEKGYRSLGAKTTTTKPSDLPAWEQDLENTTERAGRQQDKEGTMKRLRDLGYMECNCLGENITVSKDVVRASFVGWNLA
ncbi:MAG: hypothetical protein ACE5J5_07620, partial [Candidatus Hydrothermarchaeales archaeon]